MMLLLRLAEGDALLDGIVLGGVGFSVVAWAGAVMLQWSPMLLRRGEWRAAEESRAAEGSGMPVQLETHPGKQA